MDFRSIAAVSRSEIHRVHIRDWDSSKARVIEPDRLGRGGTLLTVYRPHLPKQAATPPAHIGRSGGQRGMPGSGAYHAPARVAESRDGNGRASILEYSGAKGAQRQGRRSGTIDSRGSGRSLPSWMEQRSASGAAAPAQDRRAARSELAPSRVETPAARHFLNPVPTRTAETSSANRLSRQPVPTRSYQVPAQPNSIEDASRVRSEVSSWNRAQWNNRLLERQAQRFPTQNGTSLNRERSASPFEARPSPTFMSRDEPRRSNQAVGPSASPPKFLFNRGASSVRPLGLPQSSASAPTRSSAPSIAPARRELPSPAPARSPIRTSIAPSPRGRGSFVAPPRPASRSSVRVAPSREGGKNEKH